jgi:hypothetical protein
MIKYGSTEILRRRDRTCRCSKTTPDILRNITKSIDREKVHEKILLVIEVL